MLDPISEMLTRIRNAQMAHHSEVEFPCSKLKLAVANVIASQGVVESVSKISKDNFDFIKVVLKYKEKDGNQVPAITGIKRISKEGQRIYVGKDEIRRVRNGYGFSVVSTSKGVLTGEAARKEGVGGEVICEIW
ncbi:MAG: 30S ribosomal protein S8 [Candidatus Moranbacteria bacterium]|nr:30S ribosomal protein S8 [Candidatus Moranbacteria bacterium]